MVQGSAPEPLLRTSGRAGSGDGNGTLGVMSLGHVDMSFVVFTPSEARSGAAPSLQPEGELRQTRVRRCTGEQRETEGLRQDGSAFRRGNGRIDLPVGRYPRSHAKPRYGARQGTRFRGRAMPGGDHQYRFMAVCSLPERMRDH